MIIEDPGYDGVRDAFKPHHFTFESLPVCEEGADFSRLEQMKSQQI